MITIKKSLIVALSFLSILVIADEPTCNGEASLDVMRKDDLITISNFIRKNKTVNIKDVAGLCKLPNQINMYGRAHWLMDEMIKDNGLNKDDFKRRGYVNVDCGDTNFIIDAMARDSEIFIKWLDYGFDLNRPLQYKGKVGTPIDIGFYMLNSVPQNEKGLWRKNIAYLKKRGFKSCKDLGIRCSIDY
ncbi:hypothetical protein [Bacteriovorax sp. Seq25_V]|uniref:hypothetical protein n=1 Tax=Bacteriovorax sp. Seq25_V TaxID=1201288 RepID=UPI000389DC71|nr:hypothetical protein [Bacteriovorax sp. Seq25_V]EQC48084.1 hypothetical protein M900_A0011 [Bacteriovorax sp. Seq25_V]